MRPYLHDLTDTYEALHAFIGNRGRHLGKPAAAEAADHLTAAAQIARRFDREGASLLNDHARQLRRAGTTGAAWDAYVEALATLAGVIRAAAITPQ